MITTEQIRAARAMLGLTVEELAAEAGLSPEEIHGLERGQPAGTAPGRLRMALENRGIVFLSAGEDDPGVGPGIRLRHSPQQAGMRPESLSAANDG